MVGHTRKEVPPTHKYIVLTKGFRMAGRNSVTYLSILVLVVLGCVYVGGDGGIENWKAYLGERGLELE